MAEVVGLLLLLYEVFCNLGLQLAASVGFHVKIKGTDEAKT